MTATLLNEWLKEPRAIRKDIQNRRRFLWADNYSGHNLDERHVESLRNINTEIMYFPKNATHLVQPADSFVVKLLSTANFVDTLRQ